MRPGEPSAPAGWPDTVLDDAHAAGLDIRAASLRGLMHSRYETPRQDCYSMAWLEEHQALIITVADGVGAFALSHEAAALVCRRMGTVLKRDAATGRFDWEAAFSVMSNELDTLAVARGAEIATTVVAAATTETERGSYRAEIAWVGDSAAYLLERDAWIVVGGTVKALADDTQPMVSATAALPGTHTAVTVTSIEFGSDTALFLMTDGVADPLGTGSGEVGQALAKWWCTPPDKFEFARQVGFARRSFDDDRTVVGLWPAVEESARLG